MARKTPFSGEGTQETSPQSSGKGGAKTSDTPNRNEFRKDEEEGAKQEKGRVSPPA